jgi:hypothetical protein
MNMVIKDSNMVKTELAVEGKFQCYIIEFRLLVTGPIC